MGMAQSADTERIIQDAVANARKQRRRTLTILFAIICILCATFLLFLRWLRGPDYPSILRTAYKVEVDRWSGQKVFLTDNPSEIASWIAPGPWERKKPCECLYDAEIIFHTPGGTYSALATDHSLCVARGQRDKRSRAKEFAPPPGFWAKYQELLARVKAKQAAY